MMSETKQTQQNHYNYILGTDINNKTYNGYTTCISRRLRQHNGELKGGAKYTSRHPGAWFVIISITSPDFTKHSALSFEWHVRYPTNKKPRPAEYCGIGGRIKSLPLVFSNPKFTHMMFDVYVHHETYVEYVQEILKDIPNVNVIVL